MLIPVRLTFSCGFIFLLIGGLAPAAVGQTAPPPEQAAVVEIVEGNKVYTYVEQMPQPPGGGGNASVVRLIQSQLTYPFDALRKRIQGRVLVSFEVAKNGSIRKAHITQGIGGGCDEAVLAAVRHLPRFTPGHQQGKPVAVSFTVPVTFKLPAGY